MDRGAAASDQYEATQAYDSEAPQLFVPEGGLCGSGDSINYGRCSPRAPLECSVDLEGLTVAQDIRFRDHEAETRQVGEMPDLVGTWSSCRTEGQAAIRMGMSRGAVNLRAELDRVSHSILKDLESRSRLMGWSTRSCA